MGAVGCRPGPAESAEDAYLRLADACLRQDAARFFDALDTETRWSIETVHRVQRRISRMIREGYPASERERALERIPPAAEKFDERHSRLYFAELSQAAEALADVCPRLKAGVGHPVGSIDQRTAIATVWREGGSVFRFGRDARGGWGFAELRDRWEHAKIRATHDQETVRQNTVLYGRQAGSRAKP